MTILPTKRTTSSAEDNNDNSGQGGNSERTGRRRDEHSANHIDSNKSSNRRTFRRSATPESNEHSLRKRFKESTKSGTSSSSGNSNQSAQMGTRRHNRDNQNSSSTSRGDNTTTTNSSSSSSKSLASKRSIQPNSQQPSGAEQQESDAAAAAAASVATSAIDDAPIGSATAADVAAVVDCVVDRPNNAAVELAAAAQAQQQEPLLAQDDQQQQSVQVQDALEAQQSAQQLLNLDEAGSCLLLNHHPHQHQHQPASPRPSDDDATGFNSEDEYSPSALNSRASTQANTRVAGKSTVQTHQQQQQTQQQPKDGSASISEEEWKARDATFARCLTNLGYEVKPMHEDGACLFRAIADQVYGDQEMHYVVRSHCMDYIVQNKDFFAPYVTEDFDKYVARKRQWHVHGNHLEIQAMSEMYNRRIEVYCYRIEPINIFSGLTGRGAHGRTYEPIRLSYHRMCHYNSISNPDAPSVGVGLGLPAYHPIDLNRRRLGDAVRASEQLLIEQTMLEDKLQATDWEATSEAIEEAVARESYIQYYRDAERRVRPPAAPTATVTTATHNASAASTSTTSTTTTTTTTSTTAASAAAENAADDQVTKCGGLIGAMETLACAALPEQANNTGQQSPQASSSRTNTGEQSPNAGELSEDEWNDGILAQILAESRKTYFDELKRNSKKGGSPGPSTSR